MCSAWSLMQKDLEIFHRNIDSENVERGVRMRGLCDDGRMLMAIWRLGVLGVLVEGYVIIW